MDLLFSWNKQWDVLFIVFSVTDWVQHLMWRHIDESHPLYNPTVSPKYKEEFVKFWQRIDEILGTILDIVTDSTHILLLSDHGFGPNNQTFNFSTVACSKRVHEA